MKKATVFAVGLLVLGLFAMVFAASPQQPTTTGEAKWFDMENCAFCKNLLKDPKLLDNMTWEHYDISNGLVSITTVKPEFRKSYDEAMAAMSDLGQKLEKGEVDIKDLKLCGSCQFWGMLEQMGAKIEFVQGKAADVVVMTSDNPEVVKKIKEYGQRNREELAKWEAEKAQKMK